MIILGDCLEVMKSFPDNHFSAIVTDPPYGLSFMNKGWDHETPGLEYWKEVYRIAKPGSFLFAMGGTRTFHRLTCAIEDAGFEIRDCISWLYGSGFPKSHNKVGHQGFGTALKPAWEPCILAMKPLDGTFKNNYDKWGQAGINIDGCRISSNDVSGWSISGSKESRNIAMSGKNYRRDPKPDNSKGRWPANVLFDEEAAKMLDEQSGNLKSGSLKPFKRIDDDYYSGKWPDSDYQSASNSGGASRFFYCAKTSPAERNEGLHELPEHPIRKENREGNSHDIFNTEGCGRNTNNRPVKNHHPTVKPLKLMEYLIKLVMPPKDGLLLDPFAGSGTTILAAKRLGFEAIGIEKSEEYCDIARARLENYKPELNLF